MDFISKSSKKSKVNFILGATGVEKSRLFIDLASHFSFEIINSDKIQVYKGLDILSNRIYEFEKNGIPHHLLGLIEPDIKFDAHDFCSEAMIAMQKIVDSNKVPILVGGSNSFFEALVENPIYNFKLNYESCFIWLDVSMSTLHSYVSKRVDQMVNAGLVDEVRGVFDLEANYNVGIRRAIGVPEMHNYFIVESRLDEKSKKVLLEYFIEKIKENTCKLACKQVRKIERLKDKLHWPIFRFDATTVFIKKEEEAKDVWNEVVLQPGIETVTNFLKY